jgi:pyruvate dehydrogenase E2 component (dihydrolipoyllysine-residue acetyltransferase)
MPIKIIVPRLGWSMEEGTFSEWLKHDGDSVAAGDLLFVLENDKASQEVESLDSGVLHIPVDAPKPGDKVTVGQLLGYLLADGESAPVADLPAAATATPPGTPSAPPVVTLVSDSSSQVGAEVPIITPRARRVAMELGVDWMGVSGTGRDGRIREIDIRNAAETQKPKGLSSTRRTIAERTLASQEKTVAVTLHTTADATALVQLRHHLKSGKLLMPRISATFDTTHHPPLDKGGLQGGLDEAKATETVAPTYNDILVKLVAAALQNHPVLNSRWEGETLQTCSSIHIGIAVDTEAGLLVPVIRDVTTLTLHEVALRSRNLIERAHSKRLNPDDLRGATFTVTSLGSFGIDAFTPIINYPECAILGVGRIVRQPVAVGETIALRDIITLSLTFDHRALDGAPAARFLQTLTKLIDSPSGALGLG